MHGFFAHLYFFKFALLVTDEYPDPRSHFNADQSGSRSPSDGMPRAHPATLPLHSFCFRFPLCLFLKHATRRRSCPCAHKRLRSRHMVPLPRGEPGQWLPHTHSSATIESRHTLWTTASTLSYEPQRADSLPQRESTIAYRRRRLFALGTLSDSFSAPLLPRSIRTRMHA